MAKSGFNIDMQFDLVTKDPSSDGRNKDSVAQFMVSVLFLEKKHHLGKIKLSQIRRLVGVPSSNWDKLSIIAKTPSETDPSYNSLQITVPNADFKAWVRTFGNNIYGIDFWS